MKKTNDIEKAFKLNWLYVIFCNVTIGMVMGFMCWAITNPMLNQTQRIQHISLGWNWFNILLLDFVFIACFISLLVKSYFDFNTTYDQYEIRQPSLRGLKQQFPVKF